MHSVTLESICLRRSETSKSSLSNVLHSSVVTETEPRGYAYVQEDEMICRQKSDGLVANLQSPFFDSLTRSPPSLLSLSSAAETKGSRGRGLH